MSYSARPPSRRNSGLKMIDEPRWRSRSLLVKPTGIVDLMTIVADGLAAIASAVTRSTVEVSK